MLAIHIIALIVFVPAFVLGGYGWYGNVCRYSSDGPTCSSDLDCMGPEVHCYKPYDFTHGTCCVKLEYACPRGPGIYDDPKGFPPRVVRCLAPFPGFFCGWNHYCRRTWEGPTKIRGVCCPY